MVKRLLLDTGILITLQRGQHSLHGAIDDEDDLAIAAVTAAELLEGAQTRPHRAAFVEDVLTVLPVVDYGIDVARAHARLLSQTRATGVPRGAHDLIIAATAIATNRELVTTDAKAGFGALPGVTSRVLS